MYTKLLKGTTVCTVVMSIPSQLKVVDVCCGHTQGGAVFTKAAELDITSTT